RTVVEILPNSEIKLWTRYKEPHKAYEISEGLKNDLISIHNHGDTNKILVFDAELMHSKTNKIKDTLILFDLLVCDSDYLIGMSMLERYALLTDIISKPILTENDISYCYPD